MSELDDFSAPLTAKAPAPTNPLDDFSAPLTRPVAQQKAVISANDNGEEAARALQIGKRTGIPASVVQTDLPGYDAHERQQSAVRAVENPYIAKYVETSKHGAAISGDDYWQLEEASQALQALRPETVKGKAQVGLFQGIPEIASMLGHAPGREKLYNALKELPAALGQGLLDFFETPGNIAQGKVDLTTPEGLDKGISFGIGVALGGSRVVTGRAKGLEGIPGTPENNFLAGNEAAIRRTGVKIQTFDDFMSVVRGMKTRQEIDDFLASKQPGPPGAMLQIEHAKAGSEALDAAVEAGQNSKTKVRSPETYGEFAGAHDPGSVHIDGAKALELYQKEGKVPAPGDGLLGDMGPGMAAKIQEAAATGGEVTVPTDQYLAHVDPTVHEGLRESVRLHNDGVTLEEAKELEKSIEAWHGTPHDFEQFDLTKIGTGEGAQVYGHGLYFAENKAVGEGYQKSISFVNAVAKYKAEGLSNEEALSKAATESHGQLYKVSIAADPTHFLDWDKPLSEQPQAMKALEKAVKAAEDQQGIKWEPFSEQDTGESVVRRFEALGKTEASKILAEAGIPGIKYLDQGSRAPEVPENLLVRKIILDSRLDEIKALSENERTKEIHAEFEKLDKELNDVKQEIRDFKQANETRNFVVFDDRLIKITEKNGEPIAAMVEQAVEAQKLLLGLKNEPFLTMLFKDAKSVRITDSEFKKYSNLIANQEQAILDKAVAIGKREASRRQTPEWKANEARVTEEVTKELSTQGAFAADRYFNTDKGLLPSGKRILHTHFEPMELVRADEWAPIFGFETGSDMTMAVLALETERAESGLRPKQQFEQHVKAEVTARMEAQYGNLAENIAKEAREIALADHSFDVMAEELRILAKADKTEPPLGRNEMVSWAKDSFEARDVTDAVNWDKHRRAVEKGGREAEKTLLKGDYAEAFQAKQRQFLAAVWAKESLALDKIVDQAEKKIDKFSSEETIKGIDQAHLEQIRQMLASVGIDQQFAPLEGTGPLRDFVAESEGQLAVAPWLTEASPPQIKDMTVEQFREFIDSMNSMEHVGRKTEQLENARGKAELQNVIFDIKKELDRFPFIDQPALNPSLPQRITSLGRKIVGAHLLVERMFDYTDRFDPHGPLTEWLDRPLRDSNVKELQLTEQVTKMLRDLKQHTDASINERVPNDLIPDAGDKTGFMAMTRANLRQVMLNMGNWSNLKKLSEGFGVNEADLRRWVDQHARSQDVAWVNGVWKIFDHLKPEADAMQLRDTGVPADTIEGVPWDVKGEKLNGGYYPVVYDKFNSDIQGHMAAKNPVFDKHYVQATTPHGYTVARTEYKGALDLSGSFLASRVQSMIHDIAFREAIRNANKLISNQEFRTALAQKWGKEAADLLPGWLKDIANSHTLDDNYAQGLVRAMSLVRQNVVSTLIAYNPGTFIKHGFTAAVMSADRVGAGPLLGAAKEIGVKGTAQIAKDLIVRPGTQADAAFMDAFRDSIDQGKRGENARQFILQSSAVMRNRQRQYDDSVRGAIDAMNKAGVGQTLAEFRHRQMLYGRMAVAFSDGLSAMPTWLAAYKKAYLAGEEHADAVFIADKEVSRAHGSSFVGDQPAVTRIGNSLPGELARWFVPLYKFWNHTVNNNFQLAWDAAATIRGEKPGEAPEPGANAASIARRVGLILATIFIEEQATAALDEDKKGFLHAMAMSSLRYFGGGFVGLRELSNGLASGYEPSVGMLGTISKGIAESAKDLARATSAGATVSKNWIIHTANTVGFLTGVGGSQLGKTGSFLNDLRTGKEQPRTFNQYRQGLRTGHSKARIH